MPNRPTQKEIARSGSVTMYDIFSSKSVQNANLVVGRISTSYWRNSRGIHSKRSFTYLKRHSKGSNIVAEDALEVGAETTVETILNFHQVPDGIYYVIVRDQHRDPESGAIDEYNLELVPYTEEKK